MPIKSLLFTVFVGFIVCLGIFLLILFNVDPFRSDLITIGAYFGSLYLCLLCLFALIGYYTRVQLTNREVIYSHFSVSLRQSALISLSIVLILIMQTMRVLNWWVAGIIILIVFMMEMFFRVRPV
ncbi:hypothetical protein A3F08_03560 [Candidatus Berkelbacteria bacterium RIFCSPHIGHO2_12_FULL_36_9]|uniref:Uncharacterized protein n=1 Tax=Candidatus Berkelbacteria bacterium RIFCSPHIGHO2_12_FULL_36_9 TaxID=1797469 RepID=A0A1F5EL92_9BACT|nr:MAG: hypothetical protein A3F08_03560 [Candidatus Berkelbacteria bacterium RIFCSPHIGHO2_12_FULL_36_9]